MSSYIEIFKKTKQILLVVGCLVILSASNAQPTPQKIVLKGMAQGSPYAVTYFDMRGRNLQVQVDSLLNKIEMLFSLWKPNSLINQVNSNKDVVLDSMFIDLLNKAKYVSEKSDGAFDITVGGLVKSWGFQTDRPIPISQHKIDSMLKYVGYNNISIKDNRLVKKYPEIKVDFNAIAQGYTSGMVGKLLNSYGIRNFLVDVGGGEFVASGAKPDGEPWIVGLEKPTTTSDGERKVLDMVVLNNSALVTSGDYRKYYEKDGQRYSHHIDPKTGYPVKHTLLSVSVVAKEGWDADGIATAFMVMGMEKAIAYIKVHPEYQAQFVYFEDGKMKIYLTEGMKNIMLTQDFVAPAKDK